MKKGDIMKLELLDNYNIRARLSASIILLSPIALTAFLCFSEITTFATSTVFIGLQLSLTNYLPILQRHFYLNHHLSVQYRVKKEKSLALIKIPTYKRLPS